MPEQGWAARMRTSRFRPAWAFHLTALALPLALACCATPGVGPTHPAPELVERYRPPGPQGDPWGPFIRPAAAEFGVPEPVVYAVMWAESHGCQWLNGRPMRAASGEIGLMQVPPATYATIARRIGAGPDPYLPRDNIRAGVYGLSLAMAQFGLPDALGAYQLGPTELRTAWSQGKPTPPATQDYQQRVWADAVRRTALRNQGGHWTGPERIACSWPGH